MYKRLKLNVRLVDNYCGARSPGGRGCCVILGQISFVSSPSFAMKHSLGSLSQLKPPSQHPKTPPGCSFQLSLLPHQSTVPESPSSERTGMGCPKLGDVNTIDIVHLPWPSNAPKNFPCRSAISNMLQVTKVRLTLNRFFHQNRATRGTEIRNRTSGEKSKEKTTSSYVLEHQQ